MLKEEAQTRFVLDYNITPKCECAAPVTVDREIEVLKAENAQLKQKLSQLSGLMKNGSRDFD